MAAEDLRYRQSSQYRLWSYSPARLASMRENTNSLARASISERLSSAPSAGQSSRQASSAPASHGASAPTSSANTPDPSEPSQSQSQSQQQQPSSSQHPTAPALPDFLTPAEEAQLLTYYTIELLRAGTFCKIPTDMKSTAAVFLRRFYLTNSIMTYPPTDMLKTCLFFGCKAEGWYQSATLFAEHFPNTTSDEILAGEFLLCQGLRFAFDVRHPFRALEGAIMELRRYDDVKDDQVVSAHGRAREILKFSPLVTDAYFHYTPSQIMLAALSLADRRLAERLIHETFGRHETSPPQNGTPAANGKENRKAAPAAPDVRDKLLATVEACREMLAREPLARMTEYWGTPDSNKIIKPLRQKLRRCRDPDRWDLVALQKARREQAAGSGGAYDSDEGGGGGGSFEDDGAVFGDVAGGGRDPKRRKVGGGSKAPDDPFGGPL